MSDEREPASTRLINRLQAAAERGRLEFVGGSTYMVRPQRREGRPWPRSGSAAQMFAWLDGFERGGLLPGPDGWWSQGGVEQASERHARARADVAGYVDLLVDMSLVDQLRVQVLAAMEAAGLNFKDLAVAIGKSPQSVRDALSFGNPNPRIGTIHLFEQMIRGCGRRFRVGSESARGSVDVLAELALRPGEPAGVTRMRGLAIAVERELVDAVAPSAVNRARKAREFTVRVAGAELARPRETLLHWLQGVADGAQDEIARAALTFP